MYHYIAIFDVVVVVLCIVLSCLSLLFCVFAAQVANKDIYITCINQFLQKKLEKVSVPSLAFLEA